MMGKRLDPPQRVAIDIALTLPIAGFIIWIAARSGLFRWLAALPWGSVGRAAAHGFAILMAGLVCATVMLLTSITGGNALTMLRKWRLSVSETCRLTIVLMFSVGVELTAAAALSSASSGRPEPVSCLFTIPAVVGWLFSVAWLITVTVMGNEAMVVGGNRLLPRERKARRALDRLEHRGLRYSEESLTIPDGMEWDDTDRDAMRVYADYHPGFAEDLKEWEESC